MMMDKICVIFLGLTALVVLSSAMAAPIDEKTVLYMSFDQEPEGDFVADESGYGNDGNIIGQGIEWIKDGKFGGALEFDGSSKIEVPHSESLNLDKGMTLEIWFRTEVPQKGRFLIYKIHLGGGTRNYEWGIYLTSDSTSVSTYVVKSDDEVKFISKTGDYMDGEWHFLAGTYDGKTVKCFIDGEVESTDCDDIRTSEGSVVIGTWGSNFFAGALDEPRICNVALTEDQLKSDYETGYDILAVDSAGKLSTTWAAIKDQ
jgi:hypothetical protein